MNRDEQTRKERRAKLYKATSLGLSAIVITTFFTGCAPKPNNPNTDNSGEPIPITDKQENNGSTTGGIVEYTQDSLDYLQVNITDVLRKATRAGGKDLFKDLKVTTYELKGIEVPGFIPPSISVYKADNKLLLLDGSSRVTLNLNDSGRLYLGDQIVQLHKEGYKVPLTLRSGIEKDKFFEKAAQTSLIDKNELKNVMTLYEGIHFKDETIDNAFSIKNDSGEILINLQRLADFLGFDYADNETGDVVESKKLEDNKLLESVTVTGYGGEIKYTFVKDSNKVVLDTQDIQSYINTLKNSEALDEGTKTYDKFIDVGESKSFSDGERLWIPVEYLTPAFGIQYEVLGNVVTLKDGHLLPQTVLLADTVDIGYDIDGIPTGDYSSETAETDKTAETQAIGDKTANSDTTTFTGETNGGDIKKESDSDFDKGMQEVAEAAKKKADAAKKAAEDAAKNQESSKPTEKPTPTPPPVQTPSDNSSGSGANDDTTDWDMRDDDGDGIPNWREESQIDPSTNEDNGPAEGDTGGFH